MTTKHSALELAKILQKWRTQDDLGIMNQASAMLRTIPALEAEIEMQTDISDALAQSNEEKDAYIQALMGEIEALKTSLHEAVCGMGGNYNLWSAKAKELLK